jgi:hypothetical protein
LSGDLADQFLARIRIVGGGRNAVLANGPDRLIGEQNPGRTRIAIQELQRDADLSAEHLIGAAAFALR